MCTFHVGLKTIILLFSPPSPKKAGCSLSLDNIISSYPSINQHHQHQQYGIWQFTLTHLGSALKQQMQCILVTSNSCDWTALNYQLHPIEVTSDNAVSRFWHLGDETAEQIISKFPFKVCSSTFLLMILNVSPQSSKPWSACVCDWFNGTGSIIVFLNGKTSHSSAECILSFSSLVQKIPQLWRGIV